VTSIAGDVAGALADRYRIERALGAGGMATVYLAADLKHDRKVAIKVLKPELAAVLGADRFVVEIKTTAALQHPHILPLFDSGTADGFLYYVMPYIEGETIRERLNRETQFGIEEAVRIAREVADALDYAHRHGVIHRDIKPENLLLHDGRAMVMDFGIALAVSAAAGGRMTETGLSLGTPHYMSPEQATAEKEITGRSDIYSLASVLYEMLAGVSPHEGGSAQQTIMRIITDTPRPVTELRKSVPPHVAAAVMQALEKLPADRFASAGEFSAALDGRIAPRALASHATEKKGEVRWKRIAIGALAAAFVFAAATAWSVSRRDAGSGASEAQRVEFAYRATSATNDEPLVAISPDGRRIVQAVHDSNSIAHLAVRDLGSAKPSIVAGTDGATRPAFSPDGESIAFVAASSLRKISVAGGPATMIADSVGPMIPAWAPDGRTLVFTRNGRGLSRVSASGGIVTELTSLDSAHKEFAHWSPQVLPGGKVVIFNTFSTPIAKSRMEAVDLTTRHVTVVAEGAIFARYVASGHLLFARDGAIFAIPFDPDKVRVLGPVVPVVDDLAWSVTDGYAGFDVSRNGTLVYLKASDWVRPHRVVWADRSGNERPLVGEEGQWAEPRLSPDHRWLAVTRTDPTWQIWLYDLSRQVLSQLTRTEGVSFDAVWMPDSRSLIHVVETPVYDLRRVPIDGSTPQMLVATPFDKKPGSVSPDGRVVSYFEVSDRDRLMSAPTAGGGKPEAMGASDNAQANASFSPDGRWLAYEETPTSEAMQVYVRRSGARAGATRFPPTAEVSRVGARTGGRSCTAKATRCLPRRSIRSPGKWGRRCFCSEGRTPGSSEPASQRMATTSHPTERSSCSSSRSPDQTRSRPSSCSTGSPN
jgi:eukaryotic-like serine/threonine-protein kinase